MSTPGAISVANAIQMNKNIKIVSLKANTIDNFGAKPFGDLFKILSIHLEILDLSENLIQDDGGK